MPHLVSWARSQRQDHIRKRIRAWKQRAKGQGRSSEFAYIIRIRILGICYDSLRSLATAFFYICPPSFIGVLRNHIMPVRDIPQPFTSLTDPWNGLPANITVQNWDKVLPTWPARSRHRLLLKEYVFEYYCIIILTNSVRAECIILHANAFAAA